MAKLKFESIPDAYLQRPIFFDLCICLCFWISSFFVSKWLILLRLPLIEIPDRTMLLNYVSNLSSTTVSLAGFIVASLTILISVKSSLKARGFEDADNALEFLFSTKHYQSIIGVFIKSIIELVIIFVFLYFSWLFIENAVDKTFFRILICATFCTMMAIFRSLFILFQVLAMETMKRQ